MDREPYDGFESETFRLGFVLVRRDATLPWLPGLRYRGLDREPYVPFLSDLPASVADVWYRYLDAQDDGLISRDLEAARRAKEDLDNVNSTLETPFADANGSLEILYADAVAVLTSRSVGVLGVVADQREEILTWCRSRSAGVPPVPPGFAALGHDVSTPNHSFHSAIFQPGLIEHDSYLEGRLNNAGLFENSADAVEIMNVANAAGYGWSLFSVIRIFAEPLANEAR